MKVDRVLMAIQPTLVEATGTEAIPLLHAAVPCRTTAALRIGGTRHPQRVEADTLRNPATEAAATAQFRLTDREALARRTVADHRLIAPRHPLTMGAAAGTEEGLPEADTPAAVAAVIRPAEDMLQVVDTAVDIADPSEIGNMKKTPLQSERRSYLLHEPGRI